MTTAEELVQTRRVRTEARAALQDALRTLFDPKQPLTDEQRRLLIDTDAASVYDAVLDATLIPN